MFDMIVHAARNILRNRRRSAAAVLTMALGTGALLLFGGYANSVISGVEREAVRRFGHLQVQRKGWFLYGSGSPEAYGIESCRAIIEGLASEPGLDRMIRVATPTLQFQGIACNLHGGATQAVAGFGMVVEDQDRLRSWMRGPGDVGPRPVSLPREDPDAALLGEGLARILDRSAAAGRRTPPEEAPADLLGLAGKEPSMPGNPAPGPRLDLLAATASGAPNVASVRVSATERLGVKEWDDRYLALHLPLAQRLVYGSDEPRATAIVLQLERTGQMEDARKKVEAFIARHGLDLEVLDFRTLHPACGQVQDLFRGMTGFFTALAGTIVLFSVAHAVSSAVLERRSEIGTLRALGMARAQTTGLFLCEGALLGGFGALAGCALAIATGLGVNIARLSWTPPNYSEKVPLDIRIFEDPWWFGSTLAVLAALGVISALFPALQAGRIRIVEALRHG